jgi:hypothetical protein
VAELSLQKSIYGSASRKYKRRCSSFICYKTFSQQLHYRNTIVGRRDRLGLKKEEED